MLLVKKFVRKVALDVVLYCVGVNVGVNWSTNLAIGRLVAFYVSTVFLYPKLSCNRFHDVVLGVFITNVPS